MRLLIDTHFVISLADDRIETMSEHHHAAIILHPESEVLVSVVSLWEVAIKSRLGKLTLRNPVEEWPAILEKAGTVILPIGLKHVFSLIGPDPPTLDPFDRLLLGVCAAETALLVTLDRALAQHSLAWRPFPV